MTKLSATALATVAEEARDPHISRGYQVGQLVARGGMGRVVEARRRHDRRRVAIKVLHPELVDDACCRRQMRQEAQALRLVEHPSVVKLLESGETASRQPFLVLEWLEGRNLKTMLIEDGALEPERVARLFPTLLDALARVHEQGIVHGDLKPENLMIERSGTGEERLRLLDFGIATLRGDLPDETSDEVFGTPGYLAPELYLGRAPSPASDLYAAGVVLFELLTCRAPFPSRGGDELWHEQTERPLPRVSAYLEHADDSLDALMRRVLAVQPEQRFGSALELRDALRGSLRRLCARRALCRSRTPRPRRLHALAPASRI